MSYFERRQLEGEREAEAAFTQTADLVSLSGNHEALCEARLSAAAIARSFDLYR